MEYVRVRAQAAIRRALGCALALLVLGGLMAVLAGSSALQAQADSDYADRPPQRCRSCHAEIYAEWSGSLHALAFKSERFQEVMARARQPAECLTCHSPAYNPASGRMAFEGVGCGSCHRTLDDTRRRGDGFTYHGAMSTLRSAANCGNCHGADHALTYIEWQGSAHNGARAVDCLGCHSAHGGGITAASGRDLCGSCHLQEVPTVNPHMHVEGGCTDCHPAPVKTDNVHMNGLETDVDCVACHLVTELDRYGRYLAQAGHSMKVTLTACTNCHGSLHSLAGSD